MIDTDTALRIISGFGGVGSVVAVYKWIIAQGKKEALAEQVEKTLVAKDVENQAHKAEIESLVAAANVAVLKIAGLEERVRTLQHEVAAHKEHRSLCEQENQQLEAWIDALTRPPERSQ